MYMHNYVLLKDYNIWKNVVISVSVFNDSCKQFVESVSLKWAFGLL